MLYIRYRSELYDERSTLAILGGRLCSLCDLEETDSELEYDALVKHVSSDEDDHHHHHHHFKEHDLHHEQDLVKQSLSALKGTEDNEGGRSTAGGRGQPIAGPGPGTVAPQAGIGRGLGRGNKVAPSGL